MSTIDLPVLPAMEQLSQRDFERIAAIVTQHTGIKLPPAKRVMLEGRVAKRARLAGFQRMSDYCAHLSEPGALHSEIPHLIDVATTNKTDFFREPRHFEFIAEQAVPEALRAHGGDRPTLKFWSAASSNGAEAYTLAMVLAECARQPHGFDYTILGTDISRPMIAAAQRAVYPVDMVQPVPRMMRTRYVMEGRDGPTQHQVRIVPELRRTARFEQLNLMNASYSFDRDFDLILLRNVLIYFEKEDQHAVVRRLAKHVRPGGYLLLGHSEAMIGAELGLPQVAAATFRID